MAQVPYAHIEAPRILRIDGVIAFQPNDPIPVDTAIRLGLIDSADAPEVIAAHGIASSPQFSDAELKVAAEAAAAGAPVADATTPAAPPGDAPTATPPQASAVAPRPGRPAPPTP